MADPELRAFIDAAVAKGASDRFIADLLKSSGWAEKEIFAAFREHYEQATGVSLPSRRESGESSRDAFFYLIIFSTLATWTIAVGSLLFSLIDRWFPDPVSMRGDYYPYDRLNLSFQIACILVAFPVFVLMTRRTNRSLADDPRNRYSPVRKWLTYIALVIAAGVLIGDAVTVLAHFLQGEISSRFVLKALVVGALAGGVFGYYLGEAGSPYQSRVPRQKPYGLAALAVAAGAVVLGFTATGPPAVQRAYQADDVRHRDLMLIAEAIYRQKSTPKDLEQLGSGVRIKDPETNMDYGYSVIAEGKYELCATFATNNLEQRGHSFWIHPAGRHCYQFDVSQRTWTNPGLR